MVRELSLQVAWPAYPGTERSLHGAGIEVSRASPEGRAWAQRLAHHMRFLRKMRPERDPQLVGHYDGHDLEWELVSWEPRDYARERREREWREYHEWDARNERHMAVLLSQNPKLKARIAGRRRVEDVKAALARDRYRPSLAMRRRQAQPATM
jgi:hypothetical protein